MQIGFGVPVSGAWATPQNIASFAVRAEEAGYASLWSFQRLLVPAGSDIAPVYHSVLDPMAALCYAAALTSRIRLGTAIINAPFVSPGYLAKQAASLDILSGGRHDLGLGIGWMPEEFTLSGADSARRGPRIGEYVEVLRALWAPGQVEFSGEFYQVPKGTADPKPVQAGGPPVLLGGMADSALKRIGRIADGWITASRTDLSKIGRAISVIRTSAEEAGRDAGALRVICRGVVRAGDPATGEDGERLLLSGDFDQIRADLDWLEGQGVTEVFCDLNWDPEVGSPDADPAAAADRAAWILDGLAPGR